MPKYLIANVLAQMRNAATDQPVPRRFDNALADEACAILVDPTVRSLHARPNIRNVRHALAIPRHRLEKQALRGTQPVIRGRADRLVERMERIANARIHIDRINRF